MAQPSPTPLDPLNPQDAARIAGSVDELLQWNKSVHALLQQENATKSEQLFQNAASVAEAIRQLHPQSGNRSHVERNALDTYDHLVGDRVNVSDIANGALIGTGKFLSESHESAKRFIDEGKEGIANVSFDGVKQKLEHAADSVNHVIDTAKTLSDHPEIVAPALHAIPGAASQAWNEKLDHLSQQFSQGMRSANPGEELAIAAVAGTAGEIAGMRSRPIKVIEETVVGPIETAAKKYYEAHDELRSARKLAEHADAGQDAHHNHSQAQQKANQSLSDYELSIQHKIQEARNNTPHEPDYSRSQYKNPIDQAILKDQLTPYDFDRLHSVSRHDVPEGAKDVEDGRWMLVAKFADPLMRPRVIGVDFDEDRGKFNAVSLTLNQALSTFDNALTSPKNRIHAAQQALTNEWDRNNFEGIHAPIHEATKTFPEGTANTVIRRIEENHAKSQEIDHGPQR